MGKKIKDKKKRIKIKNSSAKNDPFLDVENILSCLFHTDSDSTIVISKTTETIDVDSVDEGGLTPLHLAAQLQRNSLEQAKYLLQHYPNINIEAKDMNNETPVCHAARCQNWDTCEMLLLNGARVVNDVSRKRAVQDVLEILHMIRYIRNENYKKIKFEINWPVFNIRNNDYELVKQNTILHLAMYSKKVDCVENLLVAGADVDAPNSRGATPLHLALIYNSGTMQRDLLALLGNYNPDVNARDCEGKTPLHLAVAIKSKEAVVFLLQKRANVNELDKKGMSPLHLAVELDSNEITQELLKYGADINIRNNKEETPLHCAASLNQICDVRSLLSYNNVEVDALDADGNTPLLIAADKGHLDIIDLLQQQGANLNATDKNGRTALFLSIMKNKIENVKYFLDKKVPINIEDVKGKLPIDYAVSNAGSKVVKLLIDAKAEVKLPHLKTAVLMNQLEVVNLILDELKTVPKESDNSKNIKKKQSKKDADESIDQDSDQNNDETRKISNHDPFNNCSVLLLGLSKARDEIVSLLIKKGADCTGELWSGFTSVQCAQSLERHENLIQQMIDKDADNEKYEDEDNQTLLHKAACGCRMYALPNVMKWHCKFIDDSGKLIDNSTVQDKHGNTPLHIACGKGRNSIIKYLAENGNPKCLTMKNNNGETPLEVATRYNRTSVFVYLNPNS